MHCILVMQMNADPRRWDLRLSLPQLLWSRLPAPCSQAPDSMSSPRRSESDLCRIKDVVDSLRKWCRSAAFDTHRRFTIMLNEIEYHVCSKWWRSTAFDTEKVHYNVKWNRVPCVLSPAQTIWDPMDCSPLGSSVHGILQASILQWVAIPFSRRSFPRIESGSLAL